MAAGENMICGRSQRLRGKAEKPEVGNNHGSDHGDREADYGNDGDDSDGDDDDNSDDGC